MKLVGKIVKALCAYPIIENFRTVEFAGFVSVYLFPAEFTVFMPEMSDFFSIEKFCAFAGSFYMRIGFVGYFLKKTVFGFVCKLPEFRELHTIQCCIGQIIFLPSQSPIIHSGYLRYFRNIVNTLSTWAHLGNRSNACAFCSTNPFSFSNPTSRARVAGSQDT